MISKPDKIAELDYGNPLVKRLVIGYLFDERSGGVVREYPSGNLGTFTGAWAPGGASIISTNTRVVSTLPVNQLPSAGTVVFSFKRTASVSDYSILFAEDSTYNQFSLYYSNIITTQINAYIGVTKIIDAADGSLGVDGNQHMFFFSWNDATNAYSLHIDSTAIDSGTTAFSMSASSEKLAIGNRQAVYYAAKGLFDFFNVFDTPFSSDMRTSFMSDPYALWDRTTTVFYLFIPVGGTVYNVTVTDGVSVGESAAAGTVFNAIVTDGMAAGEQVNPAVSLAATVLDGVSLGDASAAAASFGVAVTDGVVVGDSANVNAIFSVSASDGVSLGDVISAITDYFSSLSDGVSIGDDATINATFNVKASDGAQFGDILSAIISFGVTVSDGITLSDSAIVPSSASGIVTISFVARGASITFNVSRPSITATSKKPTITGE